MSRSAVSAVLNGRRELTAPQMRRLGEFYNMDPALFMGREGLGFLSPAAICIFGPGALRASQAGKGECSGAQEQG